MNNPYANDPLEKLNSDLDRLRAISQALASFEADHPHTALLGDLVDQEAKLIHQSIIGKGAKRAIVCNVTDINLASKFAGYDVVYAYNSGASNADDVDVWANTLEMKWQGTTFYRSDMVLVFSRDGHPDSLQPVNFALTVIDGYNVPF